MRERYQVKWQNSWTGLWHDIGPEFEDKSEARLYRSELNEDEPHVSFSVFTLDQEAPQ